MFESVEEMETYVKSTDYYRQKLCFAVGFDTFDQENDVYIVALRFKFGSGHGISLSEMDQVDPDFFKYDIRSYQTYNYSGYSQLMATTAKHLMINTEGVKAPRFSLAYIPMPTGQFEVSFYPANIAGSLSAFMIETSVMFSHSLEKFCSEESVV